jgi:hypothetical protein
MDTTNKFNLDLEKIAWGALFILWGITEMVKSLPAGTGAIGIGLILLSLNFARKMVGQSMSSFTTTLAFLALLLGGLEFAQPFLHLPFEIPIFAILLLAFGLITLVRAMRK